MSAVFARVGVVLLIVHGSLAIPAVVFAQIGSRCLRPIAIPDRWDERQSGPWDPQDTFDRYAQQGQLLANPDVYRPPDDPSPTGHVAALDQGRLLQFFLGSPGFAATASAAFDVALARPAAATSSTTSCAAPAFPSGPATRSEPSPAICSDRFDRASRP